MYFLAVHITRALYSMFISGFVILMMVISTLFSMWHNGVTCVYCLYSIYTVGLSRELGEQSHQFGSAEDILLRNAVKHIESLYTNSLMR